MFITLIQTVIVFGIPFLFGWSLLRLCVGENRVAFLVPASFLTGLAALVAVFNELRFFLPMNTSVWYAYKILGATALAPFWLRLAPQPPLHFPDFLKSPGRAVLFAALLATLTLFFGIPAFQPILNDAWWCHYLFSHSIQSIATFPIPPAFSPDDMVAYHYGPDILAAIWSHVFCRDIPFGYSLNIVVFVPLTFLAAFSLVERLTGRFASALLAGGLVLAAGNLNTLGLIAGAPHTLLEWMPRLNSQSLEGLLEMAFTPSHLTSIPLAIVTLELLQAFIDRPEPRRGILLGLLIGGQTYFAEWNFILLLLALTFTLGVLIRRTRLPRIKLAGLGGLVLGAALLVAFFNNTFLSCSFSRYWITPNSFISESYPRLINESPKSAAEPLPAAEAEQSSRQPSPVPKNPQQPLITRASDEAFDHLIEASKPVPGPIPSVDTYAQNLEKPAGLLHYSLNSSHWGQIPSWKCGGSNASGWEPVLGWRFAGEAVPVLLFGIALGCWLLGGKQPPPLVLPVLLLLAVAAAAVPLLIIWEDRPTDLLRFGTSAFSFAALLLGAGTGALWNVPSWKFRLPAVLLVAAGINQAVLLGIIGLNTSVLETIQAVNATACTLEGAIAQPPAPDTTQQEIVWRNLSVRAGAFLYPLARGQKRVIVLVPESLTPPQELFPSWMKIATYGRMNIPMGRHWVESGYSKAYRAAVTSLSPMALRLLDARYVLLPSRYAPSVPEPVTRALSDSRRFRLLQIVEDGGEWLKIYQILRDG